MKKKIKFFFPYIHQTQIVSYHDTDVLNTKTFIFLLLKFEKIPREKDMHLFLPDNNGLFQLFKGLFFICCL